MARYFLFFFYMDMSNISSNTFNAIQTNIKSIAETKNVQPKSSDAPVLSKVNNDFVTINETYKNPKKTDPWRKYLMSPTATWALVAPLFLIEGKSLYDIKKLTSKIKKENIPEEAAKALKKNAGDKYFKGILLSIGIGAALSTCAVIAGNIQGVKRREKAENMVDNFNKKYDTTMKITHEDLPRILIAQCEFSKGKMTLNQNYFDDLFMGRKLEKFMKHELTHAKQFIEIARLDNGISKLNHLFVQRTASELNAKGIEELKAAYKEIQEGKGKDYKDTYVQLGKEGHKVKLCDYISALNGALESKNDDEIPIIVDKEYYEQANKNKPALTPEEKTKAQGYLYAMTNYQLPSGLQVFTKNSPYYTNILEVEAQKASEQDTDV